MIFQGSNYRFKNQGHMTFFVFGLTAKILRSNIAPSGDAPFYYYLYIVKHTHSCTPSPPHTHTLALTHAHAYTHKNDKQTTNT